MCHMAGRNAIKQDGGRNRPTGDNLVVIVVLPSLMFFHGNALGLLDSDFSFLTTDDKSQ